MKKIITLGLALLMLCSLAACGSSSSSESATVSTTEAVMTKVSMKSDDIKNESTELTSSEKKAGFVKKTVNTDNGTVTYTISETNLDAYVKSLKKDITNCRKVLINDKKIKGIETVTTEDNYTKATVTVTDEFNVEKADTVKNTYLKAMKKYQKWVDNEGAKCTVKIVDEDGNTVA